MDTATNEKPPQGFIRLHNPAAAPTSQPKAEGPAPSAEEMTEEEKTSWLTKNPKHQVAIPPNFVISDEDRPNIENPPFPDEPVR